MKKRLVALITILLLVASLSLSTFAADGFNKAVFNNAADVTVKADDMTGDAIFATTSLLGADGEISVGDGETVAVYGAISTNSSFDLFRVVIQYYADDWAYIDGFIVKIGNKSYVFSDVESNGEVASDGTIRESTGITVDSSTVPLMRELIEHRNPDHHYLYVSPLLSECSRIQEDCPSLDFKQPDDTGAIQSKSGDLLRLLREGFNVAISHELFKLLREDAMDYIRDYCLILDEELSTIEPHKITCDDLKIMQEQELLQIDPDTKQLVWMDDSYKGEYKRHMEAVKRQDLFELAPNQVFWMFNADVFKAFDRVFILTYLFDGCILASYLNINHIKYGYYHVEQTDTGHQFKEGFRQTTPEQKQKIKSLLNIYEGPLNTNYLSKKELNSTAKADSALSKNWFDTKKSKIAKAPIEQLKNNAVNYISHIRKAYKNECLWSTFKQYANKFDCPRLKYRCAKRDSKKGNGCLDCKSRDSCRVNFLACNCRATNKFKDKTVLIYLLNIYPSPVISDYLAINGYPLDADTYALAQLLQWIWRSAIREDKPVHLYLPSSRLRKLLYQYLDDKD